MTNFLNSLRPSLGFISTLGMAFLGIIVSIPDIAKVILKEKRWVVVIAAFCGFGLLAVIAERDNRLNAEKLKKENAELSTKADVQKTLNILTGGNSYPFIVSEHDDGALYLIIENRGDFPLHDIEIEMTASDLREKALLSQDPKIKSKVNRDTGKIYFAPGNIAVRDSKRFTGFRTDTAYPKRMKFGIKALNGPFNQTLELLNCEKHCVDSARLTGPNDLKIEIGNPTDWDLVTIQ